MHGMGSAVPDFFLFTMGGSLFTYKPMCLYMAGAPTSEYKPVRLYAREYGIFVVLLSRMYSSLHTLCVFCYY